MRQSNARQCLIVVAILNFPGIIRAADFTIDEWSLDAVVAGSQNDQDFTTTVQNPYDELLQAISPVPNNASFADGHHQISWDDHSGVFRLDVSAAAEYFGTHAVRVVSSARVVITPTVDLVLQYSARSDYNLLDNLSGAAMGLFVAYGDGSGNLYSGGFSHLGLEGLGQRTFQASSDLIMPAGTTWALQYSISASVYNATATHVATAAGFVEFRIVPEPATAALLVLVALIPIKRWHPPEAPIKPFQPE